MLDDSISIKALKSVNEKLRRQIAWDAAQMIRAGQESEYHSARMKAARRAARGWIPDEDLPSDEEIRDLVHSIASPVGFLADDSSIFTAGCCCRWSK